MKNKFNMNAGGSRRSVIGGVVPLSFGLLAATALLLSSPTPAQAGGYSLRGGAQANQGAGPGGSTATPPTQTTTAATTAASQAAQTATVAQHAQASLLHSVQALQAMQAAQSAARSVATAPNAPTNLGTPTQPLPTVADGLATGGLVPDSGLSATPGVANPVTTWVNASTPTQTTATNGHITVNVQQTGQQALLNWTTFNVGSNTTLAFDQSAGGANVGQWVAINKVAPNIAPSQILGSITAPGQVYVINQNGIIFGGASQVNVGALVASSLPINNNLVSRGLLNNPDLQYLFSQVDVPAGSQGPTPTFQPQENTPAPTTGLISRVDSSGNMSIVQPTGQNGDIVVQAGAQLTSADTPEHVGGKIALVGPNVNNAGTITTPDGQAILAAGLQVGFVAHDTNDPTLRGLDIVVGKVADSSYDSGATGVAGMASNVGLIEAPRADVTVIGQNVSQNGVIDSSTSVALNGRIDLLANYNSVPLINGQNAFQGATGFYPTASGTVTFGQDSQTQILPELSSTDTVVGAQLALPSLINVEAQTIHLGENAFILAPGASLPAASTAFDEAGIALTSGLTLNAGNWLLQGDGSYSLVHASGQGGQVYFDSGATIDVSGSQNISASVAEDIISGQLLGTELANSPLQRDGALRGQTIEFDIRQTGVNADGSTWIGTPLADVSGYVNLIQHTVGELTTSGGTVSISAGDSVTMQSGSTVNVSGGYINYQGANVQTTKVVTGGQTVDISQASPGLIFSGISNGLTSTSAKWSVSQTFVSRLTTGNSYQAGYVQGGNGGALSITAPSVALDGNFYGNTVAGTYQTALQSQLTKTYSGASYLPTVLSVLALPKSGSLSLIFQSQDTTNPAYPVFSPAPPSVVFQSGSNLPAAGPFGSALPAQRVAEVDLSPDLVSVDGFSNLTINNSDGNITVPADVNLNAAPGGSITMLGANIDVEGNIIAPGGSLSFKVFDVSPYGNYLVLPSPDLTRGQFTLGADASLSAAGLVVDNRSIASAPGTLPQVTGGGSVSIAGYNVNLADGAAIDVSGGVAVSSAGKVSYGKGGSIDIEAGQDTSIASILGGKLVWDPNLTKLTGYSGSTGGSLTVKAPLIQIGGSTLLNGDTLASGNTLWLNATDAGGNLLQPDFFSQGGFSAFNLKSIGAPQLDGNGNATGAFLPATLIAPNTTITPVAQSLVANTDGNQIVLSHALLQQGQRSPVSLSFSAAGAKDPFLGGLLVRSDIVMEAGSSILTDPGASVSFNANTVAILGSVTAAGGSISVTGANNSTTIFLDEQEALPTVDLGPNSVLSTAGTTLLTPNSFGLRTGSVLAGGTITIDGNIVAEAGSVLNVSGATDLLNISQASAGQAVANQPSTAPSVLTRVDSNGGSIVLHGEQELFTDATLLGAAGGSTAQGGTLSVSSGVFIANQIPNQLDATLVVTQSGLSIPKPSYYPSGQTAIGQAVVDANGNILPQTGYFAADSFNAGGFGALTLGGSVRFSGPVTINANRSITAGTAGVILADSTVNLSAPYIDLGLPFQSPLPTSQQTNIFNAGGGAFYFAPTHGTGNLNISGQLIDVGNLSLQNIGTANLTATNGDIRGDGTLDIAGALSLVAGQIYPTTENTFTIAAYDYNGITGNSSVTIAGSGNRQLPLSAGGTLDIYASNITQGGVLRAPIGTINLGSGVTGASPVDRITGDGLNGVAPVDVIPSTQNLTLASGSVTSVSAVDPMTGKALVLPYGLNQNGVEWDDPAGNNITLAGNGPNAIPDKAINVSAVNVADQSGATIDISGGGDLLSYSFVTGTGGTKDILASSNSYAVIPGYQAGYAPYYSSTDYNNSNLAVGQQVYLNASSGLPAGVYTLLPARYALLPGAYLVTPQSGSPSAATVAQTTGSSVVAGYQFNGFDTTQSGQPAMSLFRVDPPSVVAASAEYNVLSANTFLSQSATGASIAVPRLPLDSGQLVLAATQTMIIQGSVNSQAQSGGLGGLVDIASPSAILISGPNTDLSNVPANTLVLDSSGLSAFGADSLLIGGFRQPTAGGDSVTVTTNSLTVDNEGASVVARGQTLNGLSAPDVILVSKQDLTLASGAEIEQSGTASSRPLSLFLTGDGTFVRVSGNAADQTIRSGVNLADTTPSLIIGAGVTITGLNGAAAGSVTLDSTYATHLDSTAILNATTVNLDSGQISLELAPPAVTPNTFGLVLSGAALDDLQNAAQNLSLLSYSSIDIYGSGQIGGNAVSGQYPVASLALHAGEIRGFSDNGGGGAVSINAQSVTIDNSPNGAAPGAVAIADGSLTINAATIHLGTHQTNVDQYADLNLNASSGIMLDGETKTLQSDGTIVAGTGSLIASNNLTINTPLITASTYLTTQAAPSQTITAAGGNLIINSVGTAPTSITEGLGASLALVGKTVVANSNIDLPSGSVTLHATTGDVSVGGQLDVGGTAQNFNTVTKYTSGGQVILTSDAGSVNLTAGSSVNVAAPSGGGNAGTLTVNASTGSFNFAGSTINGHGGTGGQNGSFNLDIGSLPNLDALDPALNAGGFTFSRSIRVRTGDVAINDTATSQTFNLSADTGSIVVNGGIDASGVTGGTIDLTASGSVTLASGSLLTVAAQKFDDAGKGGSIALEAGADTNGNFTNTALNASTATGPLVDIETGSTLDLSVVANTAGSAALGDLTGTLQIRAPQTTGHTDLQVAPINGTIINASSIVVAGNQVFKALDGSIDNQESAVMANGTTFAGNTASILNRLYQGNANGAALSALTSVEPAAEIINPNGNLTLASNWDLSTFRFGPNISVVGSGAPGILTLRAAGNIIINFGASLSDGFNPANTAFASSANHMWTAPLLPAGDQSWSYQITAGADFSAANANAVQSQAALQNSGLGGSFLLGQGAPALPSTLNSNQNNRAFILATSNFFQTVRTGTGDITINTGNDVRLLNNLATIYTAGTQSPVLANFDLPAFSTTTNLPSYGAQYSLDGGNVTISAQGNIAHVNSAGQPDSSKELPTTWLYRQGSVDATGQFAASRGTIKSTSWWVDFSNFLEGVGALGGGNVTLNAGGSVNNVDAVVPTNARMSKQTATGDKIAADQTLTELGGGDLLVHAGNNINGGVYYVERGQGTLTAGNDIITNATRAAVTRGTDASSQSTTWLPTTLFLGKGGFDISANDDILLGPVANPFLLPQGLNNSSTNKSYFSTYATTDSIEVSSLTGTVTIRDASDTGDGSLSAWYRNVFLATNGQSLATASQPWLKSAETSFSPFSTVVALMPATLDATAFSGDLDIAGSLTLSPSSTGTIDLLAAGSINGFQVNNQIPGANDTITQVWGSSVIDLSDANPASIPGITSPLSSVTPSTTTGVLSTVNALFAESGATENLVLQTKQALHASINGNVLHADDPNPVHLFAQTGDVSGITLFSGKAAQVVAGQDVTDIALYIQNVSVNDVSIVAAGRDLIAYDPVSALRTVAATPGNAYLGQTVTDLSGTGLGAPNAGDIQISGPGTLEVLTGRNLNLGVGPNNANGTQVGISSVGNVHNPALPFGGADVVAAAGIGPSAGLNGGKLDFADFTAQFLAPGSTQSDRYLPVLGSLLGLPSDDTNQQIWDAFNQLPVEHQDILATTIFYDVLRDSGRDHNDPSSLNAGTYSQGMAAIKALFPGSTADGAWPYAGDISLTSREIKTSNGGNISLIAPGGQLTVGFDIAGNQPVDQGILTEDGGNISIFTNGSVNVGTSRIFTLHGGNVVIWSSAGDIAAGNSSKTVQSAPPTRVLIDPQSANVQTDLAGLATGGGIGVLETVVGAPPSDVDLIAPSGTVNAGDAGIRVSGNLNIAAVQVLNAGNISVGGKSAGTPTVASSNIAGLSAGAAAAGAAANTANQSTSQARNQAVEQHNELPSIITVEVLGYGEGDDDQN